MFQANFNQQEYPFSLVKAEVFLGHDFWICFGHDTSLDHIKNKFGRIKNKKLPSLPTGQLAWKEREKRGKGLPVAVCMALIVPFNVVSIF